VADQLRFVSGGVSARWSTAHDDLANSIAEANQAASDLAEVNDKIRASEISGNPANELKDSRDQLVRKLGELVGGVATQGQDGMVNVAAGGITIVAGATAERLTLSGGLDISSATSDPPTVSWGNVAVPVDSGKVAGLLSVLRTDLPNLSAQLDGVATSLRDIVNTVHNNGFTLAGAAGGDFFTGTDAKTLAVVPTSPDQLAVASAAGVVDGSNALALGDLSDDRNAEAVLGSPGPSALWRNLTTGLGVTTQSLSRAVDVQDSVVSTADTAVEASAGVNLDEEMTGMLLYQRAYEASARVITTVDEMMDTLVNHTGIVGR